MHTRTVSVGVQSGAHLVTHPDCGKMWLAEVLKSNLPQHCCGLNNGDVQDTITVKNGHISEFLYPYELVKHPLFSSNFDPLPTGWIAVSACHILLQFYEKVSLDLFSIIGSTTVPEVGMLYDEVDSNGAPTDNKNVSDRCR